YPDFYDADLRQLFAAQGGLRASSYLRRHRRRLLNSVCQWTNEKKFQVNKLLTRLIDRCDELKLYVLNDDPQEDFRVTAYITTLVMNYLFTGKFKRTKYPVMSSEVETSRCETLRCSRGIPRLRFAPLGMT